MAQTTAELQLLITAQDNASRELEQLERRSQSTFGAIEKGSLLATGAMGLLAGAAVKVAADYEHAMDAVQAVSGATNAEMAKMSTLAKEIGANTAFSAREAAGAMEELAANGVSVTDILGGAAQAAADLAAAGGITLPRAADIASTAMSVWNIQTKDMVDVVNRLAGAANVSRFGVEDMGAAIAQGGGVAAASGIEFKDFAASIALTADAFTSGSDAGTGFKTFVTGLAGNSNEAKAAIKELGLEFFDSAGNMKSMADVSGELTRVFEGMSEQQTIVYLKQIFGNDAFRVAAGLIGTTKEEFDALSQTMGDTDAADIAATRMDNMKGSVEELKGSLETMGITLGSKALPALSEMAQLLAGAVNWFAGLPETTQNLSLGFLAIAAAAPAAVSGMSKMVEFAGALATGTGSAQLKVTALALGIGALAVGVDILLQKQTGHGLMERIFGDVAAADAYEEALRDIEVAMAGVEEPAKRLEATVGYLNTKMQEYAEQNVAAGREVDAFGAIVGGNDGRIFGFNVGLSDGVDKFKEYEAAVAAAGREMKANGATAVEMIQAYRALPPELQKTFGEAVNVRAAFAELNRALKDGDFLGGLQDKLAGVVEDLRAMAPPIDSAASAAGTAITPFENWASKLEEGADAAKELNAEMDRLVGTMATTDPIYASNAIQLEIYNEALTDLDENLGGAASSSDDFHAGLGMTRGEIEAMAAPMADYNGAIDSNVASTQALVDTVNAMAPALDVSEASMYNYTATVMANVEGSEAQTTALQAVSLMFGKLAAEDIPGAVTQLQVLQVTAPEVAAVVGEEFLSKIRNGITDPGEWEGMRAYILGTTGLDIGEPAANLAATAGSGYSTTLTAEASAVGDIYGLIYPAFDIDLSGEGASVGSSFSSGIASGILSGLGGVAAAAFGVASRAVTEAKAALAAMSPSRKMMEVGADFDEGFAIGIEDNAIRVWDVAAGVATGAVGAVNHSVAGAIFDEFYEKALSNVAGEGPASKMYAGSLEHIASAVSLPWQYDSIVKAAQAAGLDSRVISEMPIQKLAEILPNITTQLASIANVLAETKNTWKYDPIQWNSPSKWNSPSAASDTGWAYTGAGQIGTPTSYGTIADADAWYRSRGIDNTGRVPWDGEGAPPAVPWYGYGEAIGQAGAGGWGGVGSTLPPIYEPGTSNGAAGLPGPGPGYHGGALRPGTPGPPPAPNAAGWKWNPNLYSKGNGGWEAKPIAEHPTIVGAVGDDGVQRDNVNWVYDPAMNNGAGGWSLAAYTMPDIEHQVPVAWETALFDGRKTEYEHIDMSLIPFDAMITGADPFHKGGTVYWTSPTKGTGSTPNAVRSEIVGHGANKAITSQPGWNSPQGFEIAEGGPGNTLGSIGAMLAARRQQESMVDNNYRIAQQFSGFSDDEMRQYFNFDVNGRLTSAKFSGMSLGNLLGQAGWLSMAGRDVGANWRAQGGKTLTAGGGGGYGRSIAGWSAHMGWSGDDLYRGAGADVSMGFGGTPVIVQVNAMDSRSFIENADKVREAVGYASSRRLGE